MGSGSNYADKLRLIDSMVLNIGTPLEVRIAIGDVDARFRDDDNPETTNYREEIIIATNDFSPDTPGLSSQLDVTVLGLKVTAASAEYIQSQTTGGGSESSITFTQGYSSGGTGSLVVTQEVTSDCYTYKLRQGTQLLDGKARFCETKRSQERPLAPHNWDEDYGPARNPGHKWVPLGRDWANLALFREDYA